MRIQDEVLHEFFRTGIFAATREIPKDAEGNYITYGLMQSRAKVMRLMKLSLENFRAFRGETTFDFNGRNALIYGENGSGKTSIWSAIDLFLGAATAQDEAKSRATFAKHRYQFNREPGRVGFEVLDEFGILEEVPRTATYFWSRDESPFQNSDIMPSARVSARLDYRAMWETYFLHRKKNRVDIWPLLIETLIPNYAGFGGQPLAEEWQETPDFFKKGRSITQDEYSWGLEGLLNFGAGFSMILGYIKELSHQILDVLSPGLTFAWEFKQARPIVDKSLAYPPHKGTLVHFGHPKVILTASLNGQPLKNHHNLLNEARLSALALSIYLAAAKINAAQARSGFKILALDDVLIGLDMSNRLPVLEVLETYFSDWQKFLFTYDRAWYELAKARLDKDKWKKFEFFASDDVPVWNEDLDNLEKAKFYLQTAREFAGLTEPVRVTPDYRAAGVYARTAFEMALKRFFFRHEVGVPYQLDPKHMLSDLWPVMEKLESNLGEGRDWVLSREFCRDMDTYTKSNLNPLCHSGFFHSDRREVLKAIAAVETLQIELAKSHKKVAPKNETPAPVVEFDVEAISDSQLGIELGKIRDELRKRSQAQSSSDTRL